MGIQQNYFTCTLGEAALISDRGGRFETINELLKSRAERDGGRPAVGSFLVSNSGSSAAGRAEVVLEPVVWSFGEVYRRVGAVAGVLRGLLSSFEEEGEGDAAVTAGRAQPVGLLAASTLDFLVIWLACVRMDRPILLIAPESSPRDIVNLCRSCGVKTLMVDGKYEELGRRAEEEDGEADKENGRGQARGLRCVRVDSLIELNSRHGRGTSEVSGKMMRKDSPLSRDSSLEKDILQDSEIDLRREEADIRAQHSMPETDDVAYWHHSSGTSTGIPKPIAQTHRGVIGALPEFNGTVHTTFTTTPLFHGGPADLLRAWTSRAMIWFFPGNGMPITASNVVRCLDRVRELEYSKGLPPVKYFTSVPFVLESMAAEKESLDLLRSMELVGVGGASLSQEVGDRLVSEDVKLVSRYGSAECGFLLSSHRDYDGDKEWSYLRLQENQSMQLRFDAREDDCFELIVPPNWPQLAKKNCDDGSYATEDLFIRHPSTSDAWKYHSPAGARLTLSTGKKFDPTSVELALRNIAVVGDALVFGSNKPYPGVLIFRDSEAIDVSDDAVKKQLISTMEKTNSKCAEHARISYDMIIPMPFIDDPIPKSSKGTVLRNRAEAKYSSEIEHAYSGGADLKLDSSSEERIRESIKTIIRHTLPTKGNLTDQTDLISFGVDSVASIQIRKRLLQLLPSDKDQLPLNIVEDCGSVEALTSYLSRRIKGEEPDSTQDTHEYMQQLVKEFSTFTSSPSPPPPSENPSSKLVILLTGATGSLGSTLLSQLLQSPKVSKIYCLVRASSSSEASQRISSTLSSRQLPSIPIHPEGETPKMIPLPSDLTLPTLGLSPETLTSLRSEVTHVVHLAWPVNFRMGLSSFVPSLKGLQNLLDFFISTSSSCGGKRKKFIFCSSLASVTSYHSQEGSPAPEEILPDPRLAQAGGYARSKWVAEQICEAAARQATAAGRQLDVEVWRVGQLSGDSRTGCWNRNEAWPAMLGAARRLGGLPRLEGEGLEWLAVDLAGRGFVQGIEKTHGEGGGGVRVFHVCNEHAGMGWDGLLEWVVKKEAGIRAMGMEEWLERLEREAAGGWSHPAVKLLGFWKENLGKGDDEKGEDYGFEMRRTKEVIGALRDVRPVDKEYLKKLWRWIDENVKWNQLSRP